MLTLFERARLLKKRTELRALIDSIKEEIIITSSFARVTRDNLDNDETPLEVENIEMAYNTLRDLAHSQFKLLSIYEELESINSRLEKIF